MATGYNIILPNGSMERVKSSSYEERVKICRSLLEKWNGYCQNNWLSVNYNNPFCPENKVKMFLSSLGYFLIGSGGETNGIITRYKDFMNGKREIPVSSCPSYVEDYVYGMVHTGGQGTQFAKDQDETFNEYMKFLDEKAEKAYKKRPSAKKKAKYELRSDRIYKAYRDGVDRVENLIVDTDGEFISDGVRYRIDMVHCRQYAPKKISEEDTLYDMDTIIRAVMKDGTIRFFDQDFHPVDDGYILRCDDAERE